MDWHKIAINILENLKGIFPFLEARQKRLIQEYEIRKAKFEINKELTELVARKKTYKVAKRIVKRHSALVDLVEKSGVDIKQVAPELRTEIYKIEAEMVESEDQPEHRERIQDRIRKRRKKKSDEKK